MIGLTSRVLLAGAPLSFATAIMGAQFSIARNRSFTTDRIGSTSKVVPIRLRFDLTVDQRQGLLIVDRPSDHDETDR